MQISGGISGAITDQETAEAQEYAIMEYERIRNDNYDIDKIVKNTGFKRIQIEVIKNYLFYDKHERSNGNIERFDPDFYIAQSWHRLAYEPNNIQPHDLLLLEHEAMELSLALQGIPQEIAHDTTEKKFNYTKAATDYYENLRKTQNRQHKETPINLKTLAKLKILQKNANTREDTKKRPNEKG